MHLLEYENAALYQYKENDSDNVKHAQRWIAGFVGNIWICARHCSMQLNDKGIEFRALVLEYPWFDEALIAQNDFSTIGRCNGQKVAILQSARGAYCKSTVAIVSKGISS